MPQVCLRPGGRCAGDRTDHQFLPRRAYEKVAEHVDDRHVRRARHGPDLRGSRSVAVDAYVRRRYRFARHERPDPRAQDVTPAQLQAIEPRIKQLFGALPPKTVVNERSMRLYLALKQVIAKEKWDFYTIQSFLGWATSTRPPASRRA